MSTKNFDVIPEPFQIMNNPQKIGKVQLKYPGASRPENYEMMYNGPILIFTPENQQNPLRWVFLPMFPAQINPNDSKNIQFISTLFPDIIYDVFFKSTRESSDAHVKYFEIICNFPQLLQTIDPHAIISFEEKVPCSIKDKKDKKWHEHITEHISLQKGNKFVFQAHYTENNAIKSFTINFNHQSYIGNTPICPKQFGSPNIRHLMFTLTDQDNNEGIFLLKSIQDVYKWVISCYYGCESQKWAPKTPISVLSQSVAQSRSVTPQKQPQNQSQTQSSKSPSQTQQNTQNKQNISTQQTTPSKPQPISTQEKQEKQQSQIQPQKPETTTQQSQQQKTQQEQKPVQVQEQKETAPKQENQKSIQEVKPQEPKQQVSVVTTTSEPSTQKVSTQNVPKSEEISNKTEEHVVAPPKPEQEQPKHIVEHHIEPSVEQKPEIKVDNQNQQHETKKPELESKEPAKETTIPAPQVEIKKDENISQNNEEKSKPKPQQPSPPTLVITKLDDTKKEEPKKEENQEQIKPKPHIPQISITTTVSTPPKAPATQRKVIKRVQKKQETPVVEQKVTEQKRFCTFPHPPPISQRLSSHRTHVAESCNYSRAGDVYKPPNSDIIIKNMKSMEKTTQNRENLLQNALSGLQLDIKSNYSDFDHCYKITQKDVLEESLIIIEPSHANISNFTPFNNYPEFDRKSLVNPAPLPNEFLTTLCEFGQFPPNVDSKVENVNKFCYVIGAIFSNGLKKSVPELSKILSEKYECLKTIKYEKKETKNILLLGAKLLNEDIVIPTIEWIKKNDDILQHYYPSALIMNDCFDDVYDYLNNFLESHSFFIPQPTIDSSVKQIKDLLIVPQFLPAEIEELNKKSSLVTAQEAADVFYRCLYLGADDDWPKDVTKAYSSSHRKEDISKVLSSVSSKKDILNSVKKRACALLFSEIVLAVGSLKEHSVKDLFTSYSCITDMNRAFHTICRLNALMKKMGPPEKID